MTSRLKYTGVPVLLLSLTGCHIWGTKPKAEPVVPVPEPARPAVVAPPPKVEPPGPPPKIETKTPAPEVPAAVASSIPKPPPPKPVRKRPTKKAQVATVPATMPATSPTAAAKEGPAPATQPAAPQTTLENPPTPPAPKLGEILTDEQKNQSLRICDESLSRAREALDQLRGVTLSADQHNSIARIRTFMKQAEQARERDPQTARQLAERADLLSRDLLRTAR